MHRNISWNRDIEIDIFHDIETWIQSVLDAQLGESFIYVADHVEYGR